jgi:NAD(P)-dependent dehydrogenase (short-subunit alcohol dehydrogenase family)
MAKQQPRTIAGRVVAITGGARGIGRTTADTLLREGAKVAIGDLDPQVTEQAASELGRGCVGFRLDVTDRESFAHFLDQVEDALGPIDVLVNNAGIKQLGQFADEDDATTIRQIDINLHGVATGTKLALKRMLPRRTGHIVNIASMAGKTGIPGGATYCATKHAVVGLSESVRHELRETPLEISCVMPGPVDTELYSGAKGGPGVKVNKPQDVADAIAEALKFPRFDVFVPKSLGVVSRISNLLPRRTAEAVGRLMKSDKVLMDIDQAHRAAYEARASASEPSLLEAAAAGETVEEEVPAA